MNENETNLDGLRVSISVTFGIFGKGNVTNMQNGSSQLPDPPLGLRGDLHDAHGPAGVIVFLEWTKREREKGEGVRKGDGEKKGKKKLPGHHRYHRLGKCQYGTNSHSSLKKKVSKRIKGNE